MHNTSTGCCQTTHLLLGKTIIIFSVHFAPIYSKYKAGSFRRGICTLKSLKMFLFGLWDHRAASTESEMELLLFVVVGWSLVLGNGNDPLKFSDLAVKVLANPLKFII